MKKVMALVIACIMAIGIFSINAFADDSKLPGGYIYTKDTVKGTHFSLSNGMAKTKSGGGSGEMTFFTIARGKEAASYVTFTFQDTDAVKGLNITEYPVLVAKVQLERTFIGNETGYFGVEINGGSRIEDANLIQSTTDWQLLVLDLSNANVDSLSTMKLHYITNSDATEYLKTTWDYFAFFKSTAEVDVLNNDYAGDLDAYIAAGGAAKGEDKPVEPAPAPTANFSMDYIQGAAPVLVNDADKSVAKLTINEGDKVTILGWALTSAGLSDVKYSVDGSAKESFTNTRERPDVLSHLGYTGTVVAASKVGIGTDASHAEINTSALNAGSHEIKFYAYTNDGVEIEYYTINLTVEAKVQEPNTGDFGLIALAFAAVSTIVVKKKKNEI